MNYMHHRAGRYRIWTTVADAYVHPAPGLTRDEMLAELSRDGDVAGAERWLARSEAGPTSAEPHSGPGGTGTVDEWWQEAEDVNPWPE